MYMNDEIFAQYEKMMSVGKHRTEEKRYYYAGTFNDSVKNVVTSYTKKGRYLTRLQLQVTDGKIIDACFKALACSIVITSMNMACEMMVGMRLENSLKLTNNYFNKRLKIPNDIPEKDSVMVEECIKNIMFELMDGDDA